MALSPYIAEIRELIGTRQLLVPTVTLLIDDGDGRYLLGRRSGIGDWITIGGMIEPEDTPAEAARREASEEIGCDLVLGPIIHAYGGPKYQLTYPNGHRISCVGVVYSARLAGEPQADEDELDRIEWFTTEQMRGIPINPFNRNLLMELGLLDKTEVEVRQATADDVSIVEGLVIAAYHPYTERMDRMPAPMLADYSKLVDDGLVWVATHAGSITGLIVMWLEQDHLYVDNVAVEPSSQGAGIGRALLAHATEYAQREAREEIRLYTNELMTENLAFYPRLGFTETHRATDSGYQRVYFSLPVEIS